MKETVKPKRIFLMSAKESAKINYRNGWALLKRKSNPIVIFFLNW